jgi:photosystem II stability/assembly factor-like uncharacterized protein
MKNLFITLCLVTGLALFIGGCGDDESCQRGLYGWAVGGAVDGYGTIIHTKDGGETWVRQGSPETIPDVSLDDVSAVDHKNVWVVGGVGDTGDDSYGTILRTTDGGETWTRQGDLSSIPVEEFLGVSAVDNEVAWVVGSGGIVLNTIDGGATWTQQAESLLPDADFQSVSAYDRNNVWAVGSAIDNTTAVIIHTTDGGQTWQREGENDIPTDPLWFYALIDIHAFNENTAWAVGSRGSVFITTNGGESWVNKTWYDDRACCGAGFTDYNGVCVVSDLKAWKALDPAGICFTTTGGDTWEQQDRAPSYASGYLFYGVTAMDENTAWVVGIDPFGDPGPIIHTTDGGKTPWQNQTNPVNAGLRRVSFVGDLK